MTNELLRLAELVEKADAGSRETDAMIAAALNIRPMWAATAPEALHPHTSGYVSLGKHGAGWFSADYTASLDAAMQLVPRAFRAEIIKCEAAGDQMRGAATVSNGFPCGKHSYAHAATPALALLAACLRAHAEGEVG